MKNKVEVIEVMGGEGEANNRNQPQPRRSTHERQAGEPRNLPGQAGQGTRGSPKQGDVVTLAPVDDPDLSHV